MEIAWNDEKWEKCDNWLEKHFTHVLFMILVISSNGSTNENFQQLRKY